MVTSALLIYLGPTMLSSADAVNLDTDKNIVTLWYQAFENNNPELLERVLSPNWSDIPPAPSPLSGPAAAKQILSELRTAFPDLKIVMREVLQSGNKITVRSEISGTQKATLMGFPARNRRMSIQAIDIHELKDGKIARTWHTEDWLTGLHQLGVFDK